MLVLGLSMVATGSLTASGASDVGISLGLGTALLVGGLGVLGGAVLWGRDNETE
jgi:hypothetical protein